MSRGVRVCTQRVYGDLLHERILGLLYSEYYLFIYLVVAISTNIHLCRFYFTTTIFFLCGMLDFLLVLKRQIKMTLDLVVDKEMSVFKFVNL